MSEKLHHHTHCHTGAPTETSLISSRPGDTWKYFAVAAINGALTIGSGLFGFHSHARNAFLAESTHDFGDTILQASRGMVAVTSFQNSRHYQKFRKVTYGATFALASWVAARSALDLAALFTNNNVVLSTGSDVAGAGIVSAGNAAGYFVANKIDSTGDNAKDMQRHTRVDFYSSAGNALCIASGMFVPYSPQLAGVAFGVYTAWSFRPTTHNMMHHS